MSVKLRIKKGDIVTVIAGDDNGKKGKVLEVLPRENKAIVEGVNIVVKHTKPNAKNPQGAILKKEAPVNISNLQLICPETGKPTRVGRMESEKPGKDGKTRLVRYSKQAKKLGVIKVID
ncbi:MAG: 50S ribosomal protein L24 [Prevotellaceae bacterium]|jgi:large subunit ribosomal protein L24|nr:50S ribosomal protein L24 [Prevotellaceae bacterium]